MGAEGTVRAGGRACREVDFPAEKTMMSPGFSVDSHFRAPQPGTKANGGATIGCIDAGCAEFREWLMVKSEQKGGNLAIINFQC